MTKDDLIKHWEVIKACKEGKQIQFRTPRSGNVWQDTPTPTFRGGQYRVKPEKLKQCWIALDDIGDTRHIWPFPSEYKTTFYIELPEEILSKRGFKCLDSFKDVK